MLLSELPITHVDGRYSRLVKQLAKVDLLILDGRGLEQFNLILRYDLLEIINERDGLKLTLMTGQLFIDQWH